MSSMIRCADQKNKSPVRILKIHVGTTTTGELRGSGPSDSARVRHPKLDFGAVQVRELLNAGHLEHSSKSGLITHFAFLGSVSSIQVYGSVCTFSCAAPRIETFQKCVYPESETCWQGGCELLRTTISTKWLSSTGIDWTFTCYVIIHKCVHTERWALGYDNT